MVYINERMGRVLKLSDSGTNLEVMDQAAVEALCFYFDMKIAGVLVPDVLFFWSAPLLPDLVQPLYEQLLAEYLLEPENNE